MLKQVNLLLKIILKVPGLLLFCFRFNFRLFFEKMIKLTKLYAMSEKLDLIIIFVIYFLNKKLL